MSETTATNPWDQASMAMIHLQQMDEFRSAGNEEAAEAEFEQAWQLMYAARREFLARIADQYNRDTAA